MENGLIQTTHHSPYTIFQFNHPPYSIHHIPIRYQTIYYKRPESFNIRAVDILLVTDIILESERSNQIRLTLVLEPTLSTLEYSTSHAMPRSRMYFSISPFSFLAVSSPSTTAKVVGPNDDRPAPRAFCS